jgi:gluconate 2-dehydrogenase gamma chain
MARLSRRDFLKAGAAGTAVVVGGLGLEACGDSETLVPAFLSSQERETLAAAVARIVPSDDNPGAFEAGVVDYIEQLLTAFEYDPPRIYAGGPFSGRQPYGDYATGQPSSDHPANAFERFVPLTRTKEIAWRMRIYGSDAVDGGDFNDAAIGPTKGLRRNYSEGLAQLDSLSRERQGASFATLTAGQQDELLKAMPPDFVSLIVEHTIEGMYAAPEYAGNRDLIGWSANKFEGDSQPLGYSIYDSIAGTYRERPDHPMSTPNPDEDSAPFDDVAIEVVSAIVAGTGGKRFF